MRLTRAEIILLTGLFLAVAMGVVAKHFRDVHRLTLPRVEPAPKLGSVRQTPPPQAKDGARN
jgi:hypothetical protein